jgi:AcrR family transcriptional regulator
LAKESRARGRPRNSSAGGVGNAVGKDALIDATIELLRTTPPSAINPITVARATGVHSSLIRYYFKNRARLLVAAAERMMARLRTRVEQSATNSDGSPRSQLFARIAAIIELNDSYPNFHQLMVNEMGESADPAARALISQATFNGTTAYGRILSAGVADGSFRDLDPAMLYTVIVGMAEFLPAARHQLEIARGHPIDKDELRATYTNFVCDLILHGIGAPKP